VDLIEKEITEEHFVEREIKKNISIEWYYLACSTADFSKASFTHIFSKTKV
jgi:hypothetical protein